MKTHRLLPIALACSAALITATAFAQQAPTAQPQSSATPTSTVATAKPAPRAVPAPNSRNCIRDTGSHIPPPKGQCLPVAGNSYSHDDLQRTGAPTVGQALQMLDPSVQIRGH